MATYPILETETIFYFILFVAVTVGGNNNKMRNIVKSVSRFMPSLSYIKVPRPFIILWLSIYFARARVLYVYLAEDYCPIIAMRKYYRNSI